MHIEGRFDLNSINRFGLVQRTSILSSSGYNTCSMMAPRLFSINYFAAIFRSSKCLGYLLAKLNNNGVKKKLGHQLKMISKSRGQPINVVKDNRTVIAYYSNSFKNHKDSCKRNPRCSSGFKCLSYSTN